MMSDAERDVLKVLWGQGPRTARQLREHLRTAGRRWAPTTVLTLLGRLETKGYVRVDRSGASNLFTAALSREAVLEQRLSNLAEEYCDGDAGSLVLALVRGQKFSPGEVNELRKLIDDLDVKARRRKRSGNP